MLRHFISTYSPKYLTNANAIKTIRVYSNTAIRNDLREFLDTQVLQGKKPHSGREWRAHHLRLKSWEELHKLWYVLLKERLMLYSERLRYKRNKAIMPDPDRLKKVKKAMNRIKLVLTERVSNIEDKRQRKELMALIGSL